MAFISNNPGFNPNAQANAITSRPRGRRFRRFLLGSVTFGIAGAIGLQMWLFGGNAEEAKAAVDIRPATAEVPKYVQPVQEAPPPQEAPPLPREETPRRTGAAQTRSQPQLPTQIAFNVNVQGEVPDTSWFADGRRPHLAHGCALRPGASLIKAVMESVTQSEIGGQAIAVVSEDVFDADGVGRLLIPAGTKLVGAYKTRGGLNFQSRRLDFVWQELTMPNGEQLSLAEANGMDVAGSMGVGGEVHTRWGELIATAALLTIFDGIQRGAVSDDPSILGSMQNSASRNMGQLGRQITGRILDWEPDILIPAGTPITVSVQKTVQVC